MNLIRKLTFSFVFLLIVVELSAQSDFRQGYVITNENDTIYGLIRYLGEEKYANQCFFKESDASEVKEFQPADIKGFRFEGYKYFVSTDVIINGINVKLFLDFLVNGVADLYAFNDGRNTHYFLQRSGNEIFELIEKKDIYTEQIKNAFSDCPRLFGSIDRTPLERDPLMFLTKRYNRAVSSEKSIFYVKPPMIKIILAPYFSFSKSTMFYENSYLYEAFDFESEIYPSAGLQIGVSFPRILRIISFQVSGEIGKNHFYDNAIHPLSQLLFEEVNLHFTTLKGKAGFKFTYPRGKFRPSILFGGSMIHTLNKDGLRVEDNNYGETIFIENHMENVSTKNIYGYVFELGCDFHHSKSLVPFLNIGCNLNTGENKEDEAKIHIVNQINGLRTNMLTYYISAGVYF